MIDNPSESEDADLRAVPLRLRLAWKLGKRVLLWIKAVLALLFMVLTGLADQYNVADIVGIVRSAFADSMRLSMYVALAAAAFVLIKMFARLPKGFSAHKSLDDGE